MSVYRLKDSAGKEKSKEYYYDFRINGRRFSGFTGTTSKAKAKQVEEAKKAEAKTPNDTTSIDGAFQQFFEEKGCDYADETTILWRMGLLQDELTKILEDEGLPPNISEIKTKHLTSYVSIRRKQPNNRKRLPSPSTINREVQLLRTIIRYAVNVFEVEMRLPNFGEALKPEPSERIVEIEHDDLEKIKENMRSDYHDALEFLVLAGPRASNVLMGKGVVLREEHVNLQKRQLTFYVKSKTPGGRPVTIPITQPMLIILANNIGNHPDAVFTYVAKSTRDGRKKGERYPLTYTAFKSAFKAAAKEINKPELRVHDLRHTAATRILRSSGNIAAARDMLGHTRVTTTEKYSHVMKQDLLEIMESTHNRQQITNKSEAQPKKNRKRS
ncbi:tyrosine-type recombinase/integrase [Polycladidibacter hongkongensis]|uniref:tyrosine-type recombinase/integrase n=1 Tax=Polycladidibacter hongkongensis TaxID=1647556 RepID=UPI00082D3ABF|nr:tyrosine-type recombinase/integrase [Pseudovibrio hongkongensis]